MPKVYEEQCKLYIEQEIEEGLKVGKTPYSIGKEIAIWVEKQFGRVVAPSTIRMQAERTKQSMNNVHTALTPSNNYEIQENKQNKDCNIITCQRCGEPYDSLSWDASQNSTHGCPYCFKVLDTCVRGGAEGTGRPPKFFVQQDKGQFRTSFTGENEWFTPVEYIEAARQVLEQIDLDPASSEFGQNRIRASFFYTVHDDGLQKPWHGKVWLNPPYSQPLIAQFAKKVVLEYKAGNITEAIILTHNYTDTSWFHLIESVASLICFTRGRVRFEAQDGTIAAPTQGSAFFYLGQNPERFREIFGKYGFIR